MSNLPVYKHPGKSRADLNAFEYKVFCGILGGTTGLPLSLYPYKYFEQYLPRDNIPYVIPDERVFSLPLYIGVTLATTVVGASLGVLLGAGMGKLNKMWERRFG